MANSEEECMKKFLIYEDREYRYYGEEYSWYSRSFFWEESYSNMNPFHTDSRGFWRGGCRPERGTRLKVKKIL